MGPDAGTVSMMSPFRRRKSEAEKALARPDYVEGFLAEPADVGTSEVDVEAVAKADADQASKQAEIEPFVKTEEAFDKNAPRPTIRNGIF